MQEIINKILSQITYLRKRLVIAYSNEYLGIDFTPNSTTPNEVACAEAVSTILKKAGLLSKVITGTWTLMDTLDKDKNWVYTANPVEGDVVVFATGTSKYGKNAPFVGHTFIIGKNGLWYSNDSWSGKWSATYTKEMALERYEKTGGYTPFYYTYISLI